MGIELPLPEKARNSRGLSKLGKGMILQQPEDEQSLVLVSFFSVSSRLDKLSLLKYVP